MEIWDMMSANGMIDDDIWYGGKEKVLPYCRPDFADVDYGADNDGGEDEGEEEGDEGSEGEEDRGPLSEELILESSE